MTAKSKCMTCYAYGHREGFGEGYEQGKDDAIAKQNNIHDTFIRKQTLKEVLKYIMDDGYTHADSDCITWLKHKIKESK